MSQEAPVQTVFACSQCGRALAQSELVHIAGNWVCADCKPAFLSRVMASGAAGASPQAWRYGGFWTRFGARLIDGLIFMVPMLIFFAMVIPSLIRAKGQSPLDPNTMFASSGFVGFFVIFFLAGGCYEILMLKYHSGTLGKMACGLKVVRPDGRSLSWGVCFGRYFMWNVVTSAIPYINFVLMLVSSIMLGVDNEKRALHDRVCDTRVIHKQSVA
jgi:uncharacterized RDD family membrane protein YckC